MLDYIFLITFVLLFFISQLETDWNWIDENYFAKTQEEKNETNARWHIFQFFGWVIAIVGFVFNWSLRMGHPILFTFKIIFIVAGTWWALYDGVLNIYMHRSFFYVTTTSQDPLSKLATPLNKGILLAAAILFALIF